MTLYKFRVLVDSDEDIFRDIEIRKDQSFETFYQAIVKAFGFRGDQLASFYMSNENWDRGHEVGLMDMGTAEYDDGPAVMRNTKMEELVTEKDQKIILVYDFLKMWCFYIELQEEPEGNSVTEYPRVALEFGTAPEEDSKELPDLFEGIDLGGFDEEDAKKNEIDEIMKEFEEDGDEPGFENIDDLDI
jgi:hypothetical protein